jgi:hypothetical protein
VSASRESLVIASGAMESVRAPHACRSLARPATVSAALPSPLCSSIVQSRNAASPLGFGPLEAGDAAVGVLHEGPFEAVADEDSPESYRSRRGSGRHWKHLCAPSDPERPLRGTRASLCAMSGHHATTAARPTQDELRASESIAWRLLLAWEARRRCLLVDACARVRRERHACAGRTPPSRRRAMSSSRRPPRGASCGRSTTT